MRQLMGINGETLLAGSAPKKNWERTRLKFAFFKFFFPFLKFFFPFLKFFFAFLKFFFAFP